MARRTGEGVRIGPITLLTLVSVLLLAVLAMLCVTTTHATEAMAQRQADALSQTYELDAFGQALLAQIDEQITESGSPAAAAALVQHAVADVIHILAELLENAAEASGAHDLRSFIDVAGTQVTFTVVAQDGKELAATATITANGYTVDAWKMTTAQELPEQALLSTN